MLAFTTCVAFAACMRQDDVPRVEEVTVDPEALAVEAYGVLGGDDPAAVLSRVVDAAMSRSYVVVLDRSAPHVRAFPRSAAASGSRHGSPAVVFGRAGAGPGELGFPSGLEIEGDSLVLVASADRLSWYTPSGEWLVGRRTAGEFGILAASVASGCGGDRWVYLLMARRDPFPRLVVVGYRDVFERAVDCS